MKKHYYIANIGQRVLLDRRKKRAKRLERLLEQQENNQWVGKKLDFFAGLILTWALFLLLFNQFISMGFALYLSVLGPMVFSWVYHRGKQKRQSIIVNMKRERQRTTTCLTNLQLLQQLEIDKLTMQLGEMLGLSNFTVLGQGLPVIGEKDGKKVAVYIHRPLAKEENTIKEIQNFVELTKNQGADAGVYFIIGTFEAKDPHHLKDLADFKVKLVDQDKLVQVLKRMEHPLVEVNLSEQLEEEQLELFGSANNESRNLLGMFTAKPTLVRKYLFIALALGLFSLLLSGLLQMFYLMLAFINLLLACYTYYRHLPLLEEEKLIVDDLW